MKPKQRKKPDATHAAQRIKTLMQQHNLSATEAAQVITTLETAQALADMCTSARVFNIADNEKVRETEKAALKALLANKFLRSHIEALSKTDANCQRLLTQLTYKHGGAA